MKSIGKPFGQCGALLLGPTGAAGGTSVNPSQTQQLSSNSRGESKAAFGDVNIGQGAGSGLKFSPMVWAIIGVAVVAVIYLIKRK